METKTLIQSSVNILRIVDLKKGNVIKLIKKEYSSNEIFYGIVIDLLNTGKSAFIELLLFKKNYGSIEGKVEVYKGSDDIAIFPATLDDVKSDLSASLESLQKAINSDKKSLAEKEEAYVRAEEFISGKMQKSLTDTNFEEVTTEEYIAEKKREEIKAIEAGG